MEMFVENLREFRMSNKMPRENYSHGAAIIVNKGNKSYFKFG
jgi:hypothetical protein